MKGYTITKEARKNLGFHINIRRKIHGLALRDLANLLEVKKDYLIALEKGKLKVINPILLIKLADILGIHYLMLYMLIGYVNTSDIANFFTNGNNYNSRIYNIIEREIL